MFNSLANKVNLLNSIAGDGSILLNEGEQQYSKYGPMKMAGVANKSLKKGEIVSLEDINFRRTSQTTDISQIELLENIKNPLQKKYRGQYTIFLDSFLMNCKIKVGFLIIGRLKSTRLPKKLLLEIKGKAIINHMIERLKLAEKVDNIIICTSTNQQDQPLKKVAKDNNIDCYLGDPDDVLQRMLDAANEFGLEYILTITADCPLVDPIYADKIVEQYLESNADLIRQFDLPHGAFSYGIKVDALRKVVELKDTPNTEIWGRYFTDTGLFNIIDLDVENSFHCRPGLRMTLDYPEDFEIFQDDL